MTKSSKTAKSTKKAAPKKVATKKVAAPKAEPAPVTEAKANPPLAREHLPIPDPKQLGVTTYDPKDPTANYAPITRLRHPDPAPSICIGLVAHGGLGSQ